MKTRTCPLSWFRPPIFVQKQEKGKDARRVETRGVLDLL